MQRCKGITQVVEQPGNKLKQLSPPQVPSQEWSLHNMNYVYKVGSLLQGQNNLLKT